ncbi:SDR family oxidoreductase [Bdellovibrionota bacterium FG-1]
MKTQSYLISGAGSGIGKAIALRIAESQQASRIFLLGRSKTKLEGVKKELPRAEEHEIIVADLKDREGLRYALSAAKLGSKNLVAVIANAGVGGENQYGPQDRWDEIMETNLGGTYRLVQECLPALRVSLSEFRSIVVVSSVLARLGVPKYSAYCASKAGLLGLMRSWAVEYAREKILVNAICPGWVDTEMSEQGIEAMAHIFTKPASEVRQAEMRRVPLGKMSEPREVAALVEFLIGGSQTSITGQAFDINNGALMP